MINQIFLIFIFISPIFGKFIDYRESIIFFFIPLLIGIFININYRLSKKQQLLELILVFLYFLSTIFSKNVGTSIYQLMIFLNVVLIFNLFVKLSIGTDTLYKYTINFGIFYATIFLIFKVFSIPDYSLGQDDVFIQFWGHSYIADFLILSIPILITRLEKNTNKSTLFKILYIFLAIVITNSRSAIFSLIIGIALLSVKSPVAKITKYLVTFSLALSLIFIFFYNNYQKTYDGSRIEYWSQAIQAFASNPILGYGPGNFRTINYQFRNSDSNNSTLAHSSFFEYLSGNGLVFTSILFSLIIFGLYSQSKKNQLLFVIGVITLINSLLDPSWSSPGILVLSLIFIFYKNDQLYNIKSTITPKITYLIYLLLIPFMLSTSLSNFLLYFIHDQNGYKINPLNPDIIDSTTDQKAINWVHHIYSHDVSVYFPLAQPKYLPTNEMYYYKLIDLNPYGSTNQRLELIRYYYQNKNWDKLSAMLKSSTPYLFNNRLTIQQSTLLTKSYYYLGIYQWQNNYRSESTESLRNAVNYSYGWSHFQIELANAYWNNGDKNGAINQIQNTCTQYPNSATHCISYLNKYKKKFPQPGIFSSIIDQIPSLSLEGK